MTDIHLVLTGLAARSKTLVDGSRQVMALLIPGDLCDIEVFVLEATDHDIVALSDTTCVLITTAPASLAMRREKTSGTSTPTYGRADECDEPPRREA